MIDKCYTIIRARETGLTGHPEGRAGIQKTGMDEAYRSRGPEPYSTGRIAEPPKENKLQQAGPARAGKIKAPAI